MAKLAGRIFVAGQEQGLLELQANHLEVVKATIPATRVDAGESFVMICPEVICHPGSRKDIDHADTARRANSRPSPRETRFIRRSALRELRRHFAELPESDPDRRTLPGDELLPDAAR